MTAGKMFDRFQANDGYTSFKVQFEGNAGLWMAVCAGLKVVCPETMVWLCDRDYSFNYRFDPLDSRWDLLAKDLPDIKYTLGAGGVSTGSKCVMTINVNRLVQNAIWDDPMNDIREAMGVMVDKAHKYLLAFNAILKDRQAAGLLPVYDAGFVKLEKQYLTVGINGFIEGAESLGIEPEGDNSEYVEYAEAVLKPIYEANRKDRSEGVMWNCEMVPSH